MKRSLFLWNCSGEAEPFDSLSAYELVWILPHFLFKKSILEHEYKTRVHFKGMNAFHV